MSVAVEGGIASSGSREIKPRSEEVAIRDLIGSLTRAVRAKDVEGMLELCAPEIVIFDMIAPLKHEGKEAVRKLWRTTLQEFESVDFAAHDLDIFVSGDMAFVRSLNRFGGKLEDGVERVGWICSTMGLSKSEGCWRIVHQHVSVPFDMETGKARLDLEPLA